MMKKRYLGFILLFLALSVGGWAAAGGLQPRQAAAQGGDIETILAQATIKGYLVSLTQNRRSPTLINFYLAAGVAGNPVAQSLSSEKVGDFEIVEEEWLDTNLYRARVMISPGERALNLEASRVKGRWQIVNLAWDDGSPADQAATTTGQAATTAVTTSGPAAEILTDRLNVRLGPGLTYPVQETLDQGDQIDIVGVTLSKDWYQVARAGETIGWISAQPDYVAVSSPNVAVAIVSVPPADSPPPTASEGGEPVAEADLPTSPSQPPPEGEEPAAEADLPTASPPNPPEGGEPAAEADPSTSPGPDFLPVTGLGRTLTLPLVFLAVAALVAKGVLSVKKRRGS